MFKNVFSFFFIMIVFSPINILYAQIQLEQIPTEKISINHLESVPTKNGNSLQQSASTQVFLFHKEVFDIIERSTRFRPDLIACTIKINNIYSGLIYANNYNASPESDISNFFLSIPYLYDNCVVISRKTNSYETISDIIQQKNVSLKQLSFINEYLVSCGMDSSKIRTSLSIDEALQGIYKCDFDYIILPESFIKNYIGKNSNEFYISRPLFYCEYRYAVPRSQQQSFISINDTLAELQRNGTLSKIASKYGIKTFKSSSLSMSARFFYILLAIGTGFFLAGLFFFFMTQNKRLLKKNEDNLIIKKLDKELIAASKTEKNLRTDMKKLAESYTECSTALKEISFTEPYSKLFTEEYIIERIKHLILIFTQSGQIFTVTKFTLNSGLFITKQNIMNFSDFFRCQFKEQSICCYNGFGTFILLFPNWKLSDIRVFINSAKDLLEKNKYPETTEKTVEYNGQTFESFMELLQ